MAHLFEKLSDLGMQPLIVPEVATLTILGGVHPGVISVQDFQVGVIKMQMQMEDSFESYAKKMPGAGRPVLICDRGAMDGKAYCSPDEWRDILGEIGKTEVELRDTRYDAVIHMVTAADGAAEFYTNENNSARKETVEEALALDQRTRDAWVLHAHRRVIPNEGDFSDKVRRVSEETLKALGVPVPVEEEVKMRLPLTAKDALLNSGIKTESVEIEQTYLLAPDGEERRVRKRSQGAASAYFHCIKSPLGHGKRIERERLITENEYEGFLARRDPESSPVLKTRFCYLHNNQSQELDVYISPKMDCTILEVETSDKVDLPPFFSDAVDVTGDPTYSNRMLSRLNSLPGKAAGLASMVGGRDISS